MRSPLEGFRWLFVSRHGYVCFFQSASEEISPAQDSEAGSP